MKEFAIGVQVATVIFAVVAFIAALASWWRLVNEFEWVASVDAFFGQRGQSSALSELPPPELPEVTRGAGISSDSHVAEVVGLALHGLRSGRPPSLDEIRGFVLKKERAMRSVQFPRFVRSILLLLGIIGTLFALKPVLAGFSTGSSLMDPSLDKLTSDRVANMVRDLGGSFTPTLIALACTVLVSIPLAAHEARLSGLALAVERFAFTRLFPVYTPPSLKTQLILAAHNLGGLAEASRDNTIKLAEASASLVKITDNLKESCAKITGSVGEYGKAAGRFESASKGIADTMSKYLGEASPLTKMALALDQHRFAIASDRAALVAEAEKLNQAISAASDSLSKEIERQVATALLGLKSAEEEAREEQVRAINAARKTLTGAEESLEKAAEFLAKDQSEKMRGNLKRLTEVIISNIPCIVETQVADSMKKSMALVDEQTAKLAKVVANQEAASVLQEKSSTTQLAELAVQSESIKKTLSEAGKTLETARSSSLEESKRQFASLRQALDDHSRQRQADHEVLQQVVEDLGRNRQAGRALQATINHIVEFCTDPRKWFSERKKKR